MILIRFSGRDKVYKYDYNVEDLNCETKDMDKEKHSTLLEDHLFLVIILFFVAKQHTFCFFIVSVVLSSLQSELVITLVQLTEHKNGKAEVPKCVQLYTHCTSTFLFAIAMMAFNAIRKPKRDEYPKYQPKSDQRDL